MVACPLPVAERVADSFRATVIHVDGFGNLVTNVTHDVLERFGAGDGALLMATISGAEHEVPYVRRFSAVSEGELLMLVAGGSYLEFAVNQGNAKELLGVGKGEKVTIRKMASPSG